MKILDMVGVVAAIIPWNAPMTQIAFKVAPALLAGCNVILKASPEALLNHMSGVRAGIVGVYQHYDFQAEKRQARTCGAGMFPTLGARIIKRKST